MNPNQNGATIIERITDGFWKTRNTRAKHKHIDAIGLLFHIEIEKTLGRLILAARSKIECQKVPEPQNITFLVFGPTVYPRCVSRKSGFDCIEMNAYYMI